MVTEPYEIGYTFDDGTEFIIVVPPTFAFFQNPNHAKNFARYLHRAGAERPNSRTHLNRRWTSPGKSVSADYRTDEGTVSLTSCIDLFQKHWDQLENDLCYFFSAEDGQTPATDDQVRTMYEALWKETGFILRNSIRVTHHDQDEPPHVHRVRWKEDLSLYQALAASVFVNEHNES